LACRTRLGITPAHRHEKKTNYFKGSRGERGQRIKTTKVLGGRKSEGNETGAFWEGKEKERLKLRLTPASLGGVGLKRRNAIGKKGGRDKKGRVAIVGKLKYKKKGGGVGAKGGIGALTRGDKGSGFLMKPRGGRKPKTNLEKRGGV